MQNYLGSVIFLNFAVDLLLLMGAGRLSGYPIGVFRGCAAALLGGLYSGACLLSGFQFLGNILWRLVSLGAMAVIAFGLETGAARPGVEFALLRLALSGVAVGLGSQGAVGILLSAAVVTFLCALGFRDRRGKARFVPVELCYNGKHLHLTALQDTGNTLRDPVTGAPVLVVGSDAAWQLTGLTVTQLKDPVRTMGALPGLRLIPYRAVGKENGLLLALRLQEVRIGSWQGSHMVAFAPEGLGLEGKFQALTGGAV